MEVVVSKVGSDEVLIQGFQKPICCLVYLKLVRTNIPN